MSRRSQRLVTSRYYPGDDDATTSSSSSSLLGGQQLPFKESTGRTIRRKSSSTKRLSPAPSTQTSYYSESHMSESYLGGSRGLAALGSSVLDDALDSSTYWGEELSTRRRRGTGDTESSKINGLLESKTYDTYASSSGYSSEDDYAGHFYSGQSSSGSGLRTAASRVGSFLWQVLTSPVWFVGWLFSGLAAAWHRLTSTVSHLGGVFFSRRYPWLKRSLLLLLLLLLLAAAAYGAWYFYPYGLSTLSLPSFPWWGVGKLSSSDVPGAGDLTALDQGLQGEQRFLARFQALEKRFEALEAMVSQWELRRGAAAVTAGDDNPSGDVLTLLEGLVNRRDAGLKEHLRADLTSHLQGELDALRAQVQRDLDGRLGKMAQASQEMETRLLDLNSEWQSLVQEDLRGSFQQEVGKLEQEVAALRRELASLKSDQEVMGKHMEGMLEQLKAMRADVEAQFPAWLTQFLSQPQRSGAAGLVLQRADLQAELQALEHKILAKVLEDQRLSARDAQAGSGVALQRGGTTGVTEEKVHLIVDQALKRYSEDRVGMVDYALESAGRCWRALAHLGRVLCSGEGTTGCWHTAHPLPCPLHARGQCHQHSLFGDLRDADGAGEHVWHPPVVPVTVPPCHPAARCQPRELLGVPWVPGLCHHPPF
ncbi:SUN domain-containing protein 2 isoform X1 [Pogoniulus pusillus]|uniref:SUN domain-containing protein 2 isoform X1 n=1 Tax=Pogoniulus pusillus TaxID=488313 RepID=UPI0030B945A3